MKQIMRGAMSAVMLGVMGCSLISCGRGSESGADERAVELSEGYNGALVRDLREDEFDDFIRIGGRLVVVDFHAEWCGPCRQLGPVMERLTNEFDGRVVLGKVNIDQEQSLAARMGVRGIPDVRIYLNGKEVERFKGAIPETKVRKLFTMHAPLKVVVDGEDAAGGGGAEEGGPAVQPMSKDWLPPGMEKK